MTTTKERLEQVRQLLEKESNTVSIRPILHHQDDVTLLVWGWEIILNSDGTWLWSATDGG